MSPIRTKRTPMPDNQSSIPPALAQNNLLLLNFLANSQNRQQQLQQQANLSSLERFASTLVASNLNDQQLQQQINLYSLAMTHVHNNPVQSQVINPIQAVQPNMEALIQQLQTRSSQLPPTARPSDSLVLNGYPLVTPNTIIPPVNFGNRSDTLNFVRAALHKAQIQNEINPVMPTSSSFATATTGNTIPTIPDDSSNAYTMARTAFHQAQLQNEANFGMSSFSAAAVGITRTPRECSITTSASGQEKEKTLKEQVQVTDAPFTSPISPIYRSSLSEAWNTMFKTLIAFKQEHDHCSVPRCYKKNQKLGNWVHTQRQIHAQGNLDNTRRDFLENVGFRWSRTSDDQWDTMFQDILDYKEEHGDCLVPYNYKLYPKLGRWVDNQRQRRKRTAHAMSEERIIKLNSIGFVWKVDEATLFDCMVKRLRRYKGRHGDCLVPHGYERDPQIGRWVQKLRGRKKQLSQSAVAQLESLGLWP